MKNVPNLDVFLRELHYAYENVSFYKHKLDEMDLHPNDIVNGQDLIHLPFTDKQDYRKNFPSGVIAKGYPINHPMMHRSKSSGTTGDRLITFEIGMLLLQRAVSCAKKHKAVGQVFSKTQRKICRYAAPNCSDVECATPHSTMQDRMLADNTLVLPVYHDLLTTPDSLIDKALEEICTFEPDLFYVDPTHFAFLLRSAEKRNVKLPKVPVVTSYSAMTQVARRQIQAYCRRPGDLAELLSSTEMGWIAMECENGIMHLNEDSFFFEFVDSQGIKAQPGSIAEMCISSTDQGAIPHLRYKTGDMVRVSEEPCSCGLEGRTVIVEGRKSYFITRDSKLIATPRSIDELIGAPAWLDVYQLEQTRDEHFVLKLSVNQSYEQLAENNLICLLHEHLGADVKIQCEICSYIPCDRSGKFQAVKGLGLSSSQQLETC